MVQLLTVTEVASQLRCHPQTVYRMAKEGRIPCVRRPGVGIRFRQVDVESWLDQGKSKPPNILQSGLNMDLLVDRRAKIGRRGGLDEMPKGKSETRQRFGFGAIYPRRTKKGTVRWYLDYRDARGKRVLRLAPQASSPEEAYQALRAAIFKEHARSCGLKQVDEDLKFKEFSKVYLRDYARQNKASWRDDQYRLEANLVPYFGSSFLDEITPLMIEKYRASRLESGVTTSTVNREHTLLKRMFNLAIDWHLATQNPATKVKLFSERDTEKERILSYAEEVRLLEKTPDYLKPILIVALNTGMRRGEILNLRWDHVDLEKRQIVVRKTKSGKNRLIPINTRLLAVLSLLVPQRAKNFLVFPNPATGKPYTEVKKSFKLACERADISDLRFHDLRHTFASRLVEAGTDIVTVRDLLGHFSVTVTQRYTHPGRSQKVAAVELLAQKTSQSGEELIRPCYTN